jgi:ribonuclease R
MGDLVEKILAAIGRQSYYPLKPKALARKLGLGLPDYSDFRRALRQLIKDGRVEVGKNNTVRPTPPHGTVTGSFRRTSTGVGYVRPTPIAGKAGPEVRIREEDAWDASTGDLVLVRLTRKPNRPALSPQGKIVKILERSARHFVGTYFERDGEGYVRVDGTVFSHSIFVGDPGAKGAKPDDKVVIEMVSYPSAEDRGEGVLTEVLGPRGQPGVDTLSVIRAHNLPDQFPEDAFDEARDAAAAFKENVLHGREDFTNHLVVTIDPVDARDFDDAIGLTRDPETGHWELEVHIADVAHFAPPGGPLDREARNRATSVYLPQCVIPMFPEIISNHLASLQPNKVRFVKSVFIAYTPEGQRTQVRFANGAIRSQKRFTYEQVLALLENGNPAGLEEQAVEPAVFELLTQARNLAMILRERRRRRGALELSMPEAELEYDEQGRVIGGHFRKDDVSHQLIEEFMLAANEAVAEKLTDLGLPFLRRVHPAPDPLKLQAFSIFARSLGYKMPTDSDRFALQRILESSAGKPEAYAVHYALLRSLKQAVYSPEEDGHYALASLKYCHFTSPIRRYPDLTVHRLLGRWLRTGKAKSDEAELAALGDHCSKMERRAEMAERELIKLKLLTYLSDRLGEEMEVIITGVADYGFFAQAEKLPVEGLVHISTLTDDYYYYEEATHSLSGRRGIHTFRLGDRVRATVVRVDLQRRQLDFRVVLAKRGADGKEKSGRRPSS